MNYDLIELAQKVPNLKIEVKLGDLLQFSKDLSTRNKEELEELVISEKAETYPTPQQVCEILNISSVTLWRWENKGYLIPIKIGGKNRFRMSDIKRILEGGKKALQNS